MFTHTQMKCVFEVVRYKEFCLLLCFLNCMVTMHSLTPTLPWHLTFGTRSLQEEIDLPGTPSYVRGRKGT